MDTILRDEVRIKIRHLVWVVIAWWALMVFGYFITTFRVDRFKSSLQDSGIKIVQELSNHVREPLLERDAQAIRTLLVNAAKSMNVIYASVTDHQNEIIAFLSGEQTRPPEDEATRKSGQVIFWEGGIENYKKIINFASEITFSGTKIGDIYIALPTGETELIRNQFGNIAFYSALILLLFIIYARFRGIVTFLLKLKMYFHRSPQTKLKLEPSLINCPMCGTQQRLYSEVYHPSQAEKKIEKKA